MDQFGAVVGPAIAFVVLALHPGQYRWCLDLDDPRGHLRGRDMAVHPGEAKAPGSRPEGPDGGARPGAVRGRRRRSPKEAAWQRLQRLRGPLLAYLVVTAVFCLGNSSDVFLILRAQDLGVATVMIPILYLMFNFVYSALSIPAGLFADRVGRRKVALMGFGVFAVTYAWMALASSAAAAWGVFVLYGVYMGIADGNGRGASGEFSTGSGGAPPLALTTWWWGWRRLPASIIAGVLYDQASSFGAVLGRSGGRGRRRHPDAGPRARDGAAPRDPKLAPLLGYWVYASKRGQAWNSPDRGCSSRAPRVFSGSGVCRRLLEEGADVVGLARSAAEGDRPGRPGGQIVPGDLSRPDDDRVGDTLQGCGSRSMASSTAPG